LRHPALFALGLILLAEWACPPLFEAWLPGGTGRNPHVLRDWDRYLATTAVARPDEFTILLLSNSQGRGPEYPASQIYPTLLAQRLSRDSGRRVRVVNWSAASNRVPEAIVLLARAQDLRPDLVVAVFPPNWFRREDYASEDGSPTPLARFEGDVTETAWLYRRRFPEAFRARYLTPVTALSAMLARWWPNYRFRGLPGFALSVKLPWLRPFFPEAAQGPWFDVDQGRAPRRRYERPPEIPVEPPEPALLDMFARAAARLRVRRVFALEPLWYPIPPRHEPAVAAIEAGLRKGGWDVWNLSRAVPWDQFLEGAVHFTAEGHQTFAAALAARLEPLLPPDPP
jgi:hypothetical protein